MYRALIAEGIQDPHVAMVKVFVITRHNRQAMPTRDSGDITILHRHAVTLLRHLLLLLGPDVSGRTIE